MSDKAKTAPEDVKKSAPSKDLAAGLFGRKCTKAPTEQSPGRGASKEANLAA